MPKVKLHSTGEEVEVSAGTSLKDVTKEHSWPMAYGCEDGMCGTCIVKIVEGMENLSPIEEKEKQTLSVMGMDDGTHRLCCQCIVNGDITIAGM